MPESDRTTINVRLVSIETELLLDREILRRERFVHFQTSINKPMLLAIAMQ